MIIGNTLISLFYACLPLAQANFNFYNTNFKDTNFFQGAGDGKDVGTGKDSAQANGVTSESGVNAGNVFNFNREFSGKKIINNLC